MKCFVRLGYLSYCIRQFCYSQTDTTDDGIAGIVLSRCKILVFELYIVKGFGSVRLRKSSILGLVVSYSVVVNYLGSVDSHSACFYAVPRGHGLLRSFWVRCSKLVAAYHFFYEQLFRMSLAHSHYSPLDPHL